MKKGLIFGFALGIFACFLLAPKQAAEPTQRTQWEYEYVKFMDVVNAKSSMEVIGRAMEGEDLEGKVKAHLNALGKDGWELFHVSKDGYMFKRPVN